MSAANGQSRRSSLLEQLLDIASGFVVSVVVWQFIVCPVFGIAVPFAQNLGITGIFTVVSLIRGYLWRRYFNSLLQRSSG